MVEKEEILSVDSKKNLNENTKCCGKFSKDFPTYTKLQSTHKTVDHNKHRRFNMETLKEKITEGEMCYFNLKKLQVEIKCSM